MNWNIHPAALAQLAAQQAQMRQAEEANRQRAYLALGPWSAVAVEAYRGVVIEGEARRKAVDEGRMGE